MAKLLAMVFRLDSSLEGNVDIRFFFDCRLRLVTAIVTQNQNFPNLLN